MSRRSAIAIPLFLAFTFTVANAQNGDLFGDEAADPIKLFDKGQDAHAKGDLDLALDYYEQALRVRPEFPEAQFQRGVALVSLKKFEEAESAFRKASELRPTWSASYARLGVMLARIEPRAAEAEQFLLKAFEIDPNDHEVLFELAILRKVSGDLGGAIKYLELAVRTRGATHNTWEALGGFQLEANDPNGALASFNRALELSPQSDSILMRRAEALIQLGEDERALQDLKRAQRASSLDASKAVRLASLYARVGSSDEAIKLLDSIDEDLKQSPEVVLLRAEIDPSAVDSATFRSSLEKLIKNDPGNVTLLARLGSLYRTTDPNRSAEYYRRALEIEPGNITYATGFAAALVQARRFDDAITILNRIIAASPDDYTAHANLAVALYEAKRYPEAIAEYRWLIGKKPDLSIAHFFIATAQDRMGEYTQALVSYEKFLSSADPARNKLEIEKVQLRLPSLRNQIKRGEGKR